MPFIVIPLLLSLYYQTGSLSSGWLTFGLTALIQAMAAAALISRMNYIAGQHSEEIKELRKWRHDFGQKEMVYDDFGERIDKLEERVSELERGRVKRN